MHWRFLQFLIVMLWLASTGLLVRHTYFPDESRNPKASPELVSDLFHSSGETTDLILQRDGDSIARISLVPHRERDPQRSADPPAGLDRRNVREVTFVGYPQAGAEDGITSLHWNGWLYMDERMELKAMRLLARSLAVRAEVELVLEPPNLRYRLIQQDQVVVDSRDPERTREMLSELAPLTAQAGVDLSMFTGADPEKLQALIQALRPTVDCRHGQFLIRSGRYPGYIVTYTFLENLKVQVYFSEVGELLKIETPNQFALLSEPFVTRRPAAR